MSGAEPGPRAEADPAVDRPVLRVVRGTPDAAELAAVVAVLTAAAGAASTSGARRTRSAWAAPDRVLRSPLPSGGWRASAAPR